MAGLAWGQPVPRGSVEAYLACGSDAFGAIGGTDCTEVTGRGGCCLLLPADVSRADGRRVAGSRA